MASDVATNAARELAQPAQGRRNFLVGVAFGLLVVLIWAGWVIATRFAVTTQLRPFDIAFIRYLVASAILMPVIFRHGLKLRQIGIGCSAMLVCGAGLPFLLVSSTGMKFAPASDVGAIMIGTMPLFVALLSALINRERFDRVRVIGFAAVVVGILCIAAHGLLDFQSGAWRGHVLFLVGAILWAGYTLAFRRAGIGPWHAAALINLCSLVIFTPFYFLVIGSQLLLAPPRELIIQAMMQGIVSAIIGLFAYGEAVRRLGPSHAAVLGSLTPVVAALLGIPLLGEIPTGLTWLGIIVVSAGVALASGGLSGRRFLTRQPGKV